MRKFALKLCLLGLLMIAVIVGMHLVVVLRMQDEIDRAYTLNPNQDVLVLSSSTLGCAMVQSAQYHNKTIWVSATSIISHSMRLHELERRGQLEFVKVLMVPFNFTVFGAQSHEATKWAWYQELPISWRYMDKFSVGLIEMFAYIASNLRWPFLIHISDTPPERLPLTGRPKKWRENFIRSECQDMANHFRSLPQGWESRLLRAYSEIAEICQRHDIRLVVLSAPLLPQFRQAQSEEVNGLERAWIEKLKSIGAEYYEVPCPLDEKVFFDARHLVPAGARIYTEALFKKLGLSIHGVN